MADHQNSTILLCPPGGQKPRIRVDGLSERDIEAAQQLMHLSESDNCTATTTTTSSTGSNKNTDIKNRKKGKKKRVIVVEEDRQSGITLNKMKVGKRTKVNLYHQNCRTLVDLYNATRPTEDDQRC
ncbi:hypothetical protein Ancab_026763 [Ancistrocladus abbreviatus]